MKELNEAYYLNVLIRRLFISSIEATTIFAPLQNAIGFHLDYEAPLGPPVSDVVVDLKSGHMYARSVMMNMFEVVLLTPRVMNLSIIALLVMHRPLG